MKPDNMTEEEWQKKLEEVEQNPWAAFEDGDRV